MEILYGGIPGRPIGDGMDGHSWWPLFENIPTEYLEAYYPLRVDGYTTVTDSGGAGLHRGGNGVEKRYVYLEPGQVSIHDDRWLTRPWGVLGGQPGERSTKILRRADGTEQVLPAKCDEVAVEPGDMLIYRTAGGGGWKDRLDRPVEAVERDVAFGLVTREKALSAATAWSIGDASTAHRGRARAPAGRARRRAGVRLRAAARGGARQLRGRDRPARAGAGQAAALVAARGPRVRARAGPQWLSRFGGAAGFGERPAVVVVDLNVGFTDPASPLACDLDDVLVADAHAARRGARARACRCSSPRSPTTRWAEAAAAVFLRKVPGAEGAAAGLARGCEIDPRLGRRDGEPVLVKAHASAFFGVAVRGAARGPRHADRVRRVDLGLRARDGRRRDAARLRADRAARVRRRPLAARRTSRRSTTSAAATATSSASTRCWRRSRRPPRSRPPTRAARRRGRASRASRSPATGQQRARGQQRAGLGRVLGLDARDRRGHDRAVARRVPGPGDDQQDLRQRRPVERRDQQRADAERERAGRAERRQPAPGQAQRREARGVGREGQPGLQRREAEIVLQVQREAEQQRGVGAHHARDGDQAAAHLGQHGQIQQRRGARSLDAAEEQHAREAARPGSARPTAASPARGRAAAARGSAPSRPVSSATPSVSSGLPRPGGSVFSAR